MKVVRNALEFEWDEGNSRKNLGKRGVTDQECEEVFFDPEKKALRDRLHSGRGERFIILGKTTMGRLLFVVVFTIRKSKIRVISGRRLNKKELPLYEEKT